MSSPGWFWATLAALIFLAALGGVMAADTLAANGSDAGGEAGVASTSAGIPAGWAPYVVRPGDTLFRLARERGVSVADVSRANSLADPGRIRVGQVLYLPPLPRADALASRGAAQSDVAESLQSARALRDGPPANASSVALDLTVEERGLLARLVTAEGGNEPLEGQTAIAAVILNRLRHPAFPKTVTAIILEPGQFKCVETGTIERPPTGSALIAVERALAGDDPSRGALFFYNPATSTALSWWRTRTVTVTIGKHNFAR